MNRNTSQEWIATLRHFTKRNARKPTVLEVDGLSIGAQQEATLLELLGVDYDPRLGRVDVMLRGGNGTHLTHSVAGVTAIDVVAADGLRQDTLRIGNAESQTLLRVVRVHRPALRG